MIADYEGDVTNLFNVNIDGELPILATRNIAIFPGVISPVIIGRKQSLNLLDKLRKHNDAAFAVFCQKDQEVENPEGKDLFEYGVYAKLVKVLEMPGPGNNLTAIIQGLGRCRLKSITRTMPFMLGEVCPAMEDVPKENDKEFATAMEDMRSTTLNYIRMNEDLPDESQFALNNISNNVIAVDFVCTNLPFSIEDKELLISTGSIKERVIQTLRVLHKEMQLLELKQNIRSKTREDLDEQQREYFLQQQIKNIKEELGGGEGSPERKDLEEKAKSKAWPEEVDKIFRKELDKLDMFNPQSPEYSIQYNYLQTMTNLPWGEYTKDNLDLKRAQRILNHDHYGMEKVKERILEYMAVLKLRGDLKSPIICLYGPPGVGKTSLGKSIAAAMKRKYVRMSLGGLHDESEIRGHRRTYVGAMPGRIIKNIQKAGSANPVFILDEIDKVTQNTINGDPSSALLEVLDPEQNSTFEDHYAEVPFDLSDVLFVATSNSYNIPPALLDRMEVISLSGYTEEEKVHIAEEHLVPKQMRLNGVKKGELVIDRSAIVAIIRYYTREAGVRGLEREISKICRKVVMANMMKEGTKKSAKTETVTVNEENIGSYLGVRKFTFGVAAKKPQIGQVNGLAWTEVGGDLLSIEAAVFPGKGMVQRTGSLGDVMKESVEAARSVVRERAESLGIKQDVFSKTDLHLHFPEGATPKDGPSAGGAITTAIVSALTRIPVRADVAMTGEITLRGEILEIGGLKEKLLAALRGGIKKVMIPEDNVKDLAEIPQNVKDGLEIVPVRWIEQVLEQALVRMPEPLPKEDLAESLAAVPAEQPGLPEIVAH